MRIVKATKLVHLLPGAFVGDDGTTIENTTIKIGNILDTSVTYSLRQAFNWVVHGVQQWHGSIVWNLASMQVVRLGIGAGMENGADARDVRRVWGGGESGGPDHTDIRNWTDTTYCDLGPGESVLYKFTKVGS